MEILYIGNKLKNSRSNLSSIQTLGALLEKENYTLYYASEKSNKLLRLLDMIISFFKYVNRVDYVIIDTYSTQNFYYALIISQLCRVFKVRYIPILRGGNLPARLKSHKKWSRLIFKNAYQNVVPSGYLKNAFAAYGYNNIKYIPNTIEIDKYPFIARNFGTPRLLWVRSFAKIYNPGLAVKVLKALKNNYPEAELCMVGPDSDGTLLEVKKLAKKLNVKVKITGKLTKLEWASLSRDYNIFINTTNFDNTPVSVIEAMALGLPIVSTNVGGMPYLIKDRIEGMLVKPENIQEMVEAIEYVFNNSEQRDLMIKKARQLTKQFDWKHVKTLWFKVLKKNNVVSTS